MDENPRPRRDLGRYVFIGFLILLIFTALLYVFGGFPGNAERDLPADAERAAVTCPDDPALAQAIDDARIGEVAGVLPSETQNLSDLAFKGPDGDDMTLASFSGKTVLLNLWATWCVPCREEMPALDQLQTAKGGDGFEVVAVNIDTGSLEKPREFLEEIDVAALPLYHDPSTDIFNEMKGRGLALGLPITAIVDGDGCLRANINGPADWASDEALNLVDVIQAG